MIKKIKKYQKKVFYFENISNEDFFLEKNSDSLFVFFIDSNIKDKKKINFYLRGEKANLLVLFFVIGKRKNNCVFDVFCHHEKKNTKAKIISKSVLFDSSCLFLNCNLIVPSSSSNSETFFSSSNLLLSDNSKCLIVPSMEIENKNVKANHAVSIGNIDEEILFYLQSRCFSKENAIKLITQGFFEEEISMLPENIKKNVLKNVIKNYV